MKRSAGSRSRMHCAVTMALPPLPRLALRLPRQLKRWCLWSRVPNGLSLERWICARRAEQHNNWIAYEITYPQDLRCILGLFGRFNMFDDRRLHDVSRESDSVHLLEHREDSCHVIVEFGQQISSLLRRAAGFVIFNLLIAVPTAGKQTNEILCCKQELLVLSKRLTSFAAARSWK